MDEFERLAGRRLTDGDVALRRIFRRSATGTAAWNEKPVSSVWV